MLRRRGTAVTNEDVIKKIINKYNLLDLNGSGFCKQMLQLLNISNQNYEDIRDVLLYKTNDELYTDIWSKIWYYKCFNSIEIILTGPVKALFINRLIFNGINSIPGEIIPGILPLNYILLHEIDSMRLLNILIGQNADITIDKSILSTLFSLKLPIFQLLLEYIMRKGLDINQCWSIIPEKVKKPIHILMHSSSEITEKIESLVSRGLDLNKFGCRITPDLDNKVLSESSVTIFGELLVNLIKLYKESSFSLKDDYKRDITNAIKFMLANGASPRIIEQIHTQKGPIDFCDYILAYDATIPREIRKIIKTNC